MAREKVEAESLQDNVLDIKKDEKLKLQLEIRGMLNDLKEESTPKSVLKKKFDNLLHTDGISNTELFETKKEIADLYSQAKGSDQTEIIKKMEQDIDDDLTKNLSYIDKKSETIFSTWIQTADKNKSIIELERDFSRTASEIVQEINQRLLTTEEIARMTYKFELNNLKQKIFEVQNRTGSERDPVRHMYKPSSGYDANPSVNGEILGTGNADAQNSRTPEIYNYGNLFKDAYPTTSYTTDLVDKTKTYDIYKEGKMNAVMSKILAVDSSIKMSNGTFGINLSVENGFAGVLKTLGGKNGKTSIGGYDFLINNQNDSISLINTPDGYRADGKITANDLKAMTKAGLLNYEHQKGFLQLDNEFAKMAKIINGVHWSDLSTFVALSDARSDQSSSLKEFVNTKENLKLLTPTYVFDFLCDRNGDGSLSYDKKTNKEQKNIGDIGNVFGQQIKFTIDQATKVQEVLHPGQGEQIVIKNIITNIDIQDSRFASIVPNKQKATELYQEFAQYTVLGNCTREKLVASIQKYPEFKVFFGAAIEKINGSGSILTPDLYDTLTGNSINRFMENDDWKFRRSLETRIDAELTKKGIAGDIIKIRENLITKLMNIADGFTIVGSDSKEGYLRNPGVQKEFANKEAKNAFVNDLANKTLESIAVGVFNPENAIRIPLDFIKQGHSESGRTLWKIQAGPSVGYNRETQDLIVTLGVGGEIAEQYNYNKVINAPLDDVASAKYIGLEARAIAGVQDHQLTAEASAGINWQKDPVMGINQIDRQYESVSKQIFSLGEKDLSSYNSIYKAFERRITNMDGSFKEFTQTNKNRLLANADFIVSFLAANKALDTISGSDRKAAINELVSILQSGNIEQWRSDLLNNLHGKIDITKLSFGVTTNALTLACNSATGTKTDTKAGSSNEGTSGDSDVGGAENITSINSPGTTYRFGLAGFYIGARLSNWKTNYQVNGLQLANTRSEIAEGRNTDKINLKTPEQYAKYLTALFNKADKFGAEQLQIKAENGKLVFMNISGIKLPQLLNIRVTEAAASQVQYDAVNDILTIGNVKDIGAYTTAQPDGVVRQLCIGSKNYKDGSLVNLFNTEENTLEGIQMKETGNYEPVTASDITSLVNASVNSQVDKDILLSCFDANGQLKKEIPGVTIENTGIIGAGTSLLFRKNREGKYFLSVQQGTGGKIGIRFADGERFAKGEVVDFKSTNYHVESPEIKKTLDSLQPNDYANLEKNTKGGLSKDFVTFMSTCDSDLNKASAALWRMIPNTGKFVEIKQTLETARINGDKKTERYLVDQFKGLFAYETAYEKQTIGQIFKPRGDAFLGLLKYAPESLKKDLKEKRDILVKENAGKKYADIKGDKPTTIPELFGYTAFYRKQVGQEGRKMSLVSSADTTVMPVGGKPYTALEGAPGDQAKDWILNRIDTNTEQKQLLLDSLLTNIKDEQTRKAFAAEIGMEDMKSILKGEPFVLESGMKKLVLNTTPAFYFKGECANESLGLVINSLEVQEAPMQEAEVKKELIPDVNVDSRIHSVAGKASVKSNNVNGIYHHTEKDWGKKETKTKTKTKAGSSDEGTDQETDVEGTPNNDF